MNSSPESIAPGPAGLSRRRFLLSVGCALPALAVPRALLADTAATRALNFVHTHTGERLKVEYFSRGQYLGDALAHVDHFLRDFRTNEVHPIDPTLLDLLHRLADATRAMRPYQVISGYRSPATNAALRQRSEGVAAGSLHMRGQAIDIRVADVPLAGLHSAALALQGGGVGYYPGPNFIHIDTGRVRRW
jgi:uncharacterized protein YcbK (DUF882 family)